MESFFHATMHASYMSRMSAVLETWAGGCKADPFLVQLAFHWGKLIIHQEFYKDLGEGSSKREMASRQRSIFRGKNKAEVLWNPGLL